MKAARANSKSKHDSAFALEDALSAYGIRTNPFPIGEVDDFYFATPELAKQHDVLRNLVEYGDLLLVVSGVEGSGKTAFLRSFLLAPGERWRFCRIDAHADMSVDALIEALLAGFDVRAAGGDSGSDEARLHAHLRDIRARGDIALIVVDEAHLLPRNCMDYLIGLSEKRGELEVRLLLASEPASLGFSTADSKRVHVVVLKPFDAQQCADYINTRLSRAGLVGDSPFDAEVVDGVLADSGGVPGTIHPLALHSLLAHADATYPRAPRRMALAPRTLAYAAALALAIGATVLVLQPGPVGERMAARDPAASGRIQGISTGAGTPEVGGRGESPGDARQAEPGAAARSVPGSAPPAAPPATAVTRTPIGGGSGRLAEGSTEGATLPKVAEAPAAVAAPAESLLEKRVTFADGDGGVVRLASNVTPKSTLEPAAPASAPGNDWLARQDPSHFVLQLVGTRDAEAARGFLERHGLAGKGTWLATSHDGKPWYVVVYGAFPNRDAARAAIETLPESLRARAPWPRTVASLSATR